tara:strand:+ start:249 stop:470 length:222 start_codon:yes stop_codon:yes gene_type:complete
MTERESKFKKLAEKRVNSAIKQLKLVGNLSNKSNYTYTDEQAKKIINALSLELNELKMRFKINQKKQSKGFTV